MFQVVVLTLYPEAFPGYLGISNSNKARNDGIWGLEVINIRDFALDKHKKVDDKVFGGGKGLLLRADVVGRAIDYAMAKYPKNILVLPSPRGKALNQESVEHLSTLEGITLICGHFEGIDERILEKYQPCEISIGDYVLSGGELSSIVIVDSILRLLPNVINSSQSFVEESFKDNLLEYPQYTYPRMWKDMEVPAVLLSGDHKKIAKWRRQKAEEKTQKIRPDLWDKYNKLNKSIME